MLISDDLAQFLAKVQITPGFHTDHLTVSIQITLCQIDHGPGYCKLNTSLLKDQNYIEAVNKLIDIELSLDSNRTFKQIWELLKISVAGSSIQFASRKQK